MKRRITNLLLLCLALFSASASTVELEAEDMLVWELQNWEVNGGHERLTLWRDGHSEVEVVPQAILTFEQNPYRPKPGWQMLVEDRRVRFLRRDIFPLAVGTAKFQQALEAGIAQLESFRPSYLDGGGTRVVVRLDGKSREVSIPYFMDKEQGSANHRRFTAVSAILGDFDRDAFTFELKR